MFLRIDKDLYVNTNSIASIRYTEDRDSIKLIITGNTGSVLHTVLYLKSSEEQMKLLIDINGYLMNQVINPEIVPGIEEVSEDE